MPKIKYKSYTYYRDDEDKQEETYEVYGVRVYEQKQREYDNSWTEEITEFLIYSGGWNWVDSKNYESVE